MNYERIYREFIADRRSKAVTGYSEVHHIRPRCMGGADEASNLIGLTPEDHFFAHLLLAKAFGGRNWSALYAMVNLGRSYRQDKLKGRIRFGHIRRGLAKRYREILSGPEGKIADKRRFKLHHFDGRTAEGNRFELADQCGITRQLISGLLRGAKKSVRGWYCESHNPEGRQGIEFVAEAKRSKVIHHLFHHDGREWTGTLSEFARQFGRPLSFQHAAGCVDGWYRSHDQAINHGTLRAGAVGKALKARGSISGARNPNADPNIYEFIALNTGERISATKFEIRQRFGIKAADLCAVFSGRQRHARGVALAS